MGTINRGIMGGFSGKVGTVIGNNRNGVDFMKGMPSGYSDAKSMAQLNQRARLSMVIQLLKPLNALLKTGFKSRKAGLTAHNVATSYHMKNALVGTYPDYRIDYSKVMISQGSLPGALNPLAVSGAEGKILFSWENNQTAYDSLATDHAILLVYNPEKERAIVPANGNRRMEESQAVNIPDNFRGDTVHCYIAFQDVTRKMVSDSKYIGAVLVI